MNFLYCRLVEGPSDEPGDMWFLNDQETWDYRRIARLSKNYLRDWDGTRNPIMVVIPNGQLWCVDDVPMDGSDGWVVTGEPPHLNVDPSIDTGEYHGWLHDGAFTR